MFILDQIPTVAEAQANLDALTREYASLTAEQKALSRRLKIVQERITTLEDPYRPGHGEIVNARGSLAKAQAAEVWDAAPAVVVRGRYGAPTERRYARSTAKQIHLYLARGLMNTRAYSRETGMFSDSETIQDLDRVLALAKG